MKILLQRNTGILSRIIKFATRGKYSHAAIQLDSGEIYETRPFRNVQKYEDLDFSNDPGDVIDIYNVETMPEQDAIILEFLERQIGKKYDYWSVFGFVIHTSKESRKASEQWFCSELVFSTFKKSGIDLLLNIDAWKVSPTILSFSPILKFEKQFVK